MSNEIEKLFYEEVREKKSAAMGVHNRTGKRGLVGKMVTPADFSGRDYREARNVAAFNIVDIVQKLQEAPALKSVLLSKMDEEYRTYRNAIEKTLEAVGEVVRLSIEALAEEVKILSGRVAELEAMIATGIPHEPKNGFGVQAAPAPKKMSALGTPRRIRWGSTPAEIKATAFRIISDWVAKGEDINVHTIKTRCPSMLRWLYGKKAVFDGLKGLVEEFRGQEGGQEAPAPAKPQPEAVAGGEGGA